MQVEVDAVFVPDQGELRVAHLDGDATDQFTPLAEPGQAKAVAIAGPWIVIGRAAATRGGLVRTEPGIGLDGREFQLRQGRRSRRRGHFERRGRHG